MPAANKFQQSNMVKESTKLSAQTSVDPDLMSAMIGEEGFMRAGAMPSVVCATKQGCQKLMQAVTQSQALVTKHLVSKLFLLNLQVFTIIMYVLVLCFPAIPL